MCIVLPYAKTFLSINRFRRKPEAVINGQAPAYA